VVKLKQASLSFMHGRYLIDAAPRYRLIRP
jgi:hypothetical protein